MPFISYTSLYPLDIEMMRWTVPLVIILRRKTETDIFKHLVINEMHNKKLKIHSCKYFNQINCLHSGNLLSPLKVSAINTKAISIRNNVFGAQMPGANGIVTFPNLQAQNDIGATTSMLSIGTFNKVWKVFFWDKYGMPENNIFPDRQPVISEVPAGETIFLNKYVHIT